MKRRTEFRRFDETPHSVQRILQADNLPGKGDTVAQIESADNVGSATSQGKSVEKINALPECRMNPAGGRVYFLVSCPSMLEPSSNLPSIKSTRHSATPLAVFNFILNLLKP